MKQLTTIGRLFYGIGIASLGTHQFITQSFRPDILPPFAWAQPVVFPILAGVALLVSGIMITGLFTIKRISTKNVCLYLGFSFLVLIVTCHLPYILVLNADKILQLQIWFGVGEALAYAGGAFVMAGSFVKNDANTGSKNVFELSLEKLIPVGRIFYSFLIILFGFSHFVYAESVSTMVPKWIGPPMFWTYFVGVALIGAGIAVILKIWIRLVALLLALMLFLFFALFHVPDAIANPYVGGGNEIVRALVALLFCGIALTIAQTETRTQNS